jgi:hypothetical protein
LQAWPRPAKLTRFQSYPGKVRSYLAIISLNGSWRVKRILEKSEGLGGGEEEEEEEEEKFS